MDPAAQPTPKTRPNDAVYHWIYLILAAIVLALSFILFIRPDGMRVALPWMDVTLPESCTFKRVFGFGCPGCGLTRSFICLAHGRLVDAWTYNPAGPLFFLIVAGQIPYRALQIWRIRTKQEPWRGDKFTMSTIWILLAALVFQWLFRSIMHAFS